MIKENQGLLNKIHVVLDAVVIVISYVLSWYLRFRSGIFEMDPWYLSLQVYMSVLIFIIPGYLLLYYIFQLYDKLNGFSYKYLGFGISKGKR